MAENSSSLNLGNLIADFESIVARLPWRDSSLAPHEPRMPAHQYVVVPKLDRGALDDCRMFDLVVDEHPESYLGYFRGYQRPNPYLEIGDGWRYWKVWIRGRSWPHRQRLDACEPPRRVDQGAEPIPPEEWAAKYPYWPQGSGYGEWKRESSGWVFYPEEEPRS